MPGVFQFSQNANANASSVPTVSWPEGMSPSQINDSARAEMAAVACYRDDCSGMLLTTGTGQNYQITATNQGFDTLANFDGKEISFTVHATNIGSGGTTISIDGFANLPLRSSPGVELLPGTLIAGSSYTARFKNADGALYLSSFFGPSPFLVPLGGMIDYFGTSSPNASLALPFGQAISRTTYATLFALIGTAYGAGDGSTTYNIPDLRGRVVAGADNMGGTAAGRLTSASGMGTGLLGQTGGAETETLTLAQVPTGITSANASQAITVYPNGTGIAWSTPVSIAGANWTSSFGASSGVAFAASVSSASVGSVDSFGGANAITVTSNNTGGGAHPNVQPTIIVNKLLRIL